MASKEMKTSKSTEGTDPLNIAKLSMDLVTKGFNQKRNFQLVRNHGVPILPIFNSYSSLLHFFQNCHNMGYVLKLEN
jgi:hypothetical protein